MPSNRNNRSRRPRNSTPTPAPAPEPLQYIEVPVTFQNEVDGDYYYQQMEDRVIRQMEERAAQAVAPAPLPPTMPHQQEVVDESSRLVGYEQFRNEYFNPRAGRPTFADIYGNLQSDAREVLNRYAFSDIQITRQAHDTWAVDMTAQPQPQSSSFDDDLTEEMSGYLRESRREQAARILHQRQEDAERRRLEAEARRAEEQAAARRRLEEQQRVIREQALAMRVNLTAEQQQEFQTELDNYNGTGWTILGAFRLPALYTRYVGRNTGTREYVCIFCAPECRIDERSTQIFILEKHTVRNIWNRQMTESYSHVRQTAPQSDICCYLVPLFEYFTVRGRSVGITGGQLLMQYALDDRNILSNLDRQYRPDVAEANRRRQRFQEIACQSPATFDAEQQDRPRTARGQAAANAAARHGRNRQPARA